MISRLCRGLCLATIGYLAALALPSAVLQSCWGEPGLVIGMLLGLTVGPCVAIIAFATGIDEPAEERFARASTSVTLGPRGR